jgi:hypothetical protein
MSFPAESKVPSVSVSHSRNSSGGSDSSSSSRYYGSLANGASAVSLFALFIIGGLAFTGMDTTTLGWITLGIGGVSPLLLPAFGGKGLTHSLKNNKTDTILLVLVSAAFIAIGSLSGMGILSSKLLGGTIMAINIAFLTTLLKANCYKNGN